MGWPASCFFFSSRRRHTRLQGDWSSDVCSSDLSLADLSILKTNSKLSFSGSMPWLIDRKSTRLNSSHLAISYAVFCLKKNTVSFRGSLSTPMRPPCRGSARNAMADPFPVPWCRVLLFGFFFIDTATTEIYALSLHDALPI